MPSVNQVLLLDGFNDRVEIAHDSLVDFDAGESFTLEARVKTNSRVNFPRILSKRGNVSPNKGYEIFVEPASGRVTFNMDVGAATIGVSGTTAIDDGRWHHVAVVFEGTTQKLFMDGILQASRTDARLADGVANTVPLSIGGTNFFNTSGSNFGNGSIDEVRIWNVARTDAEILANRTGSLTGNEAGLVAYYTFEEVSGTTVTDRSGNGNDGTLANGAGVVEDATVPNAPADSGLSDTNVSENSPNDPIVGTLSTTDPNPGDSFTYTLADDTGGQFPIVNGDQLATADGNLPNYENALTDAIRARSTDSAGASYDRNLAISPTNAGETALLLKFSFNENQNPSSGTLVLDSSGNGNNGIYRGNGGAIVNTPSIVGTAADFDGIDDYIEIDSPAVRDLTANFTIATWINPDRVTGVQRILSNGVDGQGFGLTMVDGLLFFTLYGVDNFGVNANLQADRWTHLAVTFDSEYNATFYINGVSAGQFFGYSPALVSTVNYQIGAFGNIQFFDGQIDELALYNRTLTAAEIAALANLAPTDLSLDKTTIAENSPNDTVIGILSTTDPNSGDSFTYTLLDNAGGRFKIVNGNQLAVANGSLLDYEANTSHNVTVRTTDSAGASFEKVIAIGILDDPGDNPKADLTPYRPNNWSGPIVVSTGTGTNTDATTITTAQTLYIDWAVLNQGSRATTGRFFTLLSIDGVPTRAWFTDPPLNSSFFAFVTDTPIGPLTAGTHTIRLEADYTGVEAEENETNNFFEKTITVLRANNAPTDLALDRTTIAENSPNDTVIGTLSTTDPDAGDSFTYTLLDNAGGRFKIVNGNQLAVANGNLLNYENALTHAIRARSTDSAGASYDRNFTITLTDVSETTPLFKFSFNENQNPSSGTPALDSSGNGNDGIYRGNGGALVNTLSVVGTAADFDGIDDYIEIQNPTVRELTANFTIAAWINPDRVTGVQRIFSNSLLGQGFGFGLSGSQLLFTTYGIQDYYINADIQADRWTHVAVTFDSAYDATFYVNGVSIGTIAGNAPALVSTVNYQIGALGNIQFFDGQIDELALYNRTVTAPEIAALANLAPTDLSLDKTAIAENSPNDTVIGTLSTTDPDAGDSFTYTLLDNAGGRFKIVNGNQLAVANGNLLNYETNASHNVTVRTTDSAGASFEKVLTIGILDDPGDNPKADLTPYKPNNWSGPIVVSTRTGTNTDATTITTAQTLYIDWATLNQGSAPTANQFFSRLLVDGVLARSWFTSPPLNSFFFTYVTDTPIGPLSAGTHTIRLETDYTGAEAETNESNNFFEKTITVTLANFAPTDLVLSNATVAERSPNDTAIGTLTTTDPDAGDTHTYTLLDDAGGRFKLVGDRLVVADGSLLDSSLAGSHVVRVNARDSGGLFIERNLVITVLDTPQAPTAIALSNNSIAEKSPGDTIVGVLSSTDPDPDNSFTYTLLDNAGGRFKLVNGNQIAVANGSLLNFAQNSNHSIRVRTTDDTGLSFEGTLDISVFNVNDAPTALNLSNNSVAENSASNTVIGTLGTVDPDAGDRHTYTLVDNAGGRFTLIGDRLAVSNGSLLNYSQNTSHTVRVRTTDAAGASFERDLVINLTPIDRTLPDLIAFKPNDWSNPIVISTARGTNSDATDLTTLDTLYIDWAVINALPGAGQPATKGTVNRFFTRLSLDGVTLTDWFTDPSLQPDFFTSVSDYPIAPLTPGTHILTLAIDYSGLEPERNETDNVYERYFTVLEPPTYKTPTDIEISNDTIAENTADNTIVGSLSSIDSDPGDTHTYQLLDDAGGQFKLVNGDRIAVANGALLDYESGNEPFTPPSRKIRVRSTDSKGLSYEKDLVIKLTDRVEYSQDKLIGHFKLDETLQDFSYGTALNSANPDASAYYLDQYGKISALGSPGVQGTALSVKEGADIVFPGAFPTDSADWAFTYSAWINPDAIQSVGAKLFRTEIPNPVSGKPPLELLGFGVNGQGLYLNILRNKFNPPTFVPVPYKFENGEWQHVALAMKDESGGYKTFSVYANGELVYEGKYYLETGTSGLSHLLYRDPADRTTSYQGAIDEILVYDRALPDYEIRDRLYYIESQPPTDIQLSDNVITDSDRDGTIVGDLTSVDKDSDVFTYTLLDDAGGRFALAGVRGNQLVIRDGTKLDALVDTTHTIRVRTTDFYGNSYERNLVVQVLRGLGYKEPRPIDIGLLGYFRLDERGSGTGKKAIDVSGNGKHGVYEEFDSAILVKLLLEPELYTEDDVVLRSVRQKLQIEPDTFTGPLRDQPGVSESAVYFDGQTDIIKVEGINSETAGNNFTVSAWIMPARLKDVQMIFSTPETDSGFGFGLDGKNLILKMGKSEDTGIYSFTPPAPILADEWAHVALTLGANREAIVYLNGQEVGRTIVDRVPAFPARYDSFYSIGGQLTSFYSRAQVDKAFKGSIDEFRFYNRVLGSEEIQILTNTSPTNLSLDNDTVNENARSGKVIGQLSTRDFTPDDEHTYTLLDDASGRFALDGDRLVVADGALLDYESAPEQTIRVRVTDKVGNVLERDLTIQVKDLPDVDKVGRFNGIDGVVTAGDPIAWNGSRQFTLEAWIFSEQIDGQYRGIFGYDPGDDRLRGPSLGIIDRTGINFGFGDGGTWNSRTVNDAIAPGTWQHLAVSFDGTTLKLYVDGELKDSIDAFAGKIPLGYENGLTIGRVDDRYFKGQIDEVRVWNVERSAEESALGRERALTGGEPGLVAHYSFDRLDGETAIDSTATTAGGILTGGASIVPSTKPVLILAEGGLEDLSEAIALDLGSVEVPVLGQLPFDSLTTFITALEDTLTAARDGKGLSLLDFANLIKDSLPEGATVTRYQPPIGTVPSTGTDPKYIISYLNANTLASQSISGSLGIPGLGISARGSADIQYNEIFRMTVGQSPIHGLYIDTEGTLLKLDLAARLSNNFSATGQLGFLQVALANNPKNPTGVTGAYELTIEDPDNLPNPIEDGSRLTVNELAVANLTVPDILAAKLTLTPNIGLKGKTSLVGSPAIPSLEFDLAVKWDSTTYEGGELTAGSVLPTTLAFNNVSVNLGQYLTDVVKPIAVEIDKILSPIRPIIQFVSRDIDFFHQLGLTGLVDYNKDGLVTVIDLVNLFNTKIRKRPPIDERFFKSLQALDKVSTQILNLANTPPGDPAKILIGSYLFKDLNTKAVSLFAGEKPEKVEEEESSLDEQLDSEPTGYRAKIKNAIDAIRGVEGLDFAILTDPTQAINLLIGEDSDLIAYDIPDLDFVFEVGQEFSIFPPIYGYLGGGFSAKTNLLFGYDTHGIKKWIEGNYADPLDVLDGFFVEDKTGNELQLRAFVEAGAGVDVVIAAGYILGGIQGRAGLDLVDVGEFPAPSTGDEGEEEEEIESDGKLRPSELLSRPLFESFNLNGDVSAYLDAKVRLGLAGAPLQEWRFNLLRVKLFEFSFGAGGTGFTANKYISNATVFLDTNLNGLLDASEPFSYSGPDGSFSLTYYLEKYDTNGNGTIDPREGQLVSVGGVDTYTELPVWSMFTAPANYAAITPVTTLINTLQQRLVPPEEAREMVLSVLGLDPNLDLATFDPVKAINEGNAAGVSLLVAHVQLHTVMEQMAVALEGISSFSLEAIGQIVVGEIVNQIQDRAELGEQLDLSSADTIRSLLEATTASLEKLELFSAPEIPRNWDNILAIADEISGIIALGNQKIEDLATNTPLDRFLRSVSDLQSVLIADTASEFKAAVTGKITVAELLENNTDDALNGKVASLGDFSTVAVVGTEENDILTSIADKPLVIGNGGSDRLIGLVGNDQMFGGEGDDTLESNGGTDLLDGGNGNDLYLVGPNSGGTFISDTSGADVIAGISPSLEFMGIGKMGFLRSGTALVIDLNQNGEYDFTGDLTVLKFFADNPVTSAGEGFIETVGTLAGDDILALTVNHAPILQGPIADRTAVAFSNFSLTLARDTFSDVDPLDYPRYRLLLENGNPLPEWLTFDPSTLTLEGIPDAGEGAVYSLKLIGTDLAGLSAETTFRLTVVPEPLPPSVAPIHKSGDEDTAIAFTADDFTGAFSGPSGNPLAKIRIVSLPEEGTLKLDGVPIDRARDIAIDRLDTLTYTPTSNFTGTVGFDWNGFGGTFYADHSARVTLAIAPVNDAPILNRALSDREAIEGSAFRFSLPADNFLDSDEGNTLTYSAILANNAPLPGWLTFNPITRTFSGTPEKSDVAVLDLRVIATDNSGSSASGSFLLTVNPLDNPPEVINPIANVSVNEDADSTIIDLSGVFSDVDNDIASISKAVRANDNPALVATTIVNNQLILETGENRFGTATITVRGTSNGQSVDNTFTVTVSPVNDAPIVQNPIADTTALENQLFTFTVLANTFSDVDGDSLAYSLGTSLPPGLNFNASTGLFSGTPTTPGTYQITVIAGDPARATVSDTFALNVLRPVTVPNGASVISGGNTNERLDVSGKSGTYRLDGGGGDDLLIGSDRRDVLQGGTGNDSLYGGGDVDRLFGDEGNDLLDGGSGADLLTGGTGADRFVLTAGTGADRVLDFNSAEGDRFALSGINFGQLTFSGNQILLNGQVLAYVTDSVGNPVTNFNTRPEWFVSY